jgi:transcriptional regulator with AAA-type ATPase domain
MYYSFRDRFQDTISQSLKSSRHRAAGGPNNYYGDLEQLWKSCWKLEGLNHPSEYKCWHIFACLFQIRRAYFFIHEFIWGDSLPSQSLRAEIWESIFSHDFRRVGLLLYDRMEKIPTLIAGPSGTGKELTARAIGLSRHIPFDPESRQFTQPLDGIFHPVNIAALSPTVIESELFGHAKGAFTGAVKSRSGWFENCPRGHSVFLDEIGELSPELQVKLLRVVQNREFHRLGETTLREFTGNLIVATNRDFNRALAEGTFREDLYYRL